MTNKQDEQHAGDVEGFATADFFLKLPGVQGEITFAQREAGSGQATGKRQHSPIDLMSFSWGVTNR